MSTFVIVILCVWSIVAAFWSWSNYQASKELARLSFWVSAMSKSVASLECQSLRDRARALNSPTARRRARARLAPLHSTLVRGRCQC